MRSRVLRFVVVAAVAIGCGKAAVPGSENGAVPESKPLGVPPVLDSGSASAARPDSTEALGLLDELVAIFRLIKDGAGAEVVAKPLDAVESRAAAFEAKGGMAAAGRGRIGRLVNVIRAIVSPARDDASRAETQAKVDAFVRAVKGPAEPSVGPGLQAIGPILMDEVVELHLVIDPSADRKEVQGKYLVVMWERGAPASSTEGLGVLGQLVDVLWKLKGGATGEFLAGPLDAVETRARALESKGAVAAEFRERTLRLAAVMRAVMTPAQDEATRAAVQTKVDAFARAVKGPTAPQIGRGLKDLGPILMDEIVELHLLIEPAADRQVVTANYLEVMRRP